MYKNYKIVVNTAAGRRRYMRLLIPYILESNIVDRYDLWINTNDNADIAFFKEIASISPKVKLIWQPDGIVNGIESINAFYKFCIDSDTIYFKLDDDVIWMEPNLIEKMVKFRIDNPQHFLVTPLVINNGFSTLLLYVNEKFKLKKGYNIDTCWEKGMFAKELHELFIKKYLIPNKYNHLYVQDAIIAMNRFSINAILWFGKDLAKISGLIPGNDEEFLSLIYPTKEKMTCAWNGNAIISHFAFGSQREIIDKTDILNMYTKYADKEYKDNNIYNEVQKIYNHIEQNLESLYSLPLVYKQAESKMTVKSNFSKWDLIPNTLRGLLSFYIAYKKEHYTTNYIEIF